MANLFWHDAHLKLVARQGKGQNMESELKLQTCYICGA